MAEDHGHDQHGGGGAAGGGGGGDDHGKGEHKAHKSHGGGHGGGGHEEHAGAPEWLISFADNVALLMGFFVILLAMNMGPKGKPSGSEPEGPGGGAPMEFTEAEMNLIELKMGILDGFHRKPKVDSKDPAERKLAQDFTKVQEQKARKNRVQGESPDRQTTPNGSVSRSNLTVDFDDGKDLLSVRSRELIAEVVDKELKGKGWVIEVRGHVSASEAKNAQRALIANAGASSGASGDPNDPSLFGGDANLGSGAGYQLSFQRARVVAEEMVRHGIPWRNIRIVACSDMARAKPREAEEPSHRRSNQRVEVIQTTDPLPPDPLSQAPGAN